MQIFRVNQSQLRYKIKVIINLKKLVFLRAKVYKNKQKTFSTLVLSKHKIKVIIVLAFLTTGLSHPAIAQNGANFKAGLALVGNINLNSFSDTAMHKKAYHIGVDARIGPYGFYLSPGLHYYNVDIASSNGFGYFSSQPKYHIIKGPLNIAYKMFITRKFKFRLKGGVDINYVLLIDDNELGIDYSSVNDAYFGMNLGIGFDISRFTIDFNYESGLTNSIKDDDNSKLNYFSTSFGFFF